MNDTLDEIIVSTTGRHIFERWEYLKFRIREVSQDFARNSAQEINLIISQLSEYIQEMEEKLESANMELLERTKQDLQGFADKKAQSNMFRSKVQFYEFGEKPSSYYLSLEKSRYNAKTCTALFNEENQLITNTRGILKLQSDFYRKLYTSIGTSEFTVTNDTEIFVPEDMQKKMDEQISMDELAKAIMSLPNNKTCGNDGIPIDFYKVFWKKIKNLFHELTIEAYECEELHRSALIGVINLIPKQNKDTRKLNFLRPITLCNSDYKTIEKAIAIRIEPALEHIISSDQRGFQKNQRISSNIRTVFDIITYTEKKNIDGLILQLDFEKCFDKIKFKFLISALRFFNFPERIIKWTQIIYNGFQACTQNNGHFSELFPGNSRTSPRWTVQQSLLSDMRRNNGNFT